MKCRQRSRVTMTSRCWHQYQRRHRTLTSASSCRCHSVSLTMTCRPPAHKTRLYTHTHTQPFNGLWSGSTRVGQYQKKHSPTHTHPDHRTSFINFLHLLRSIASSLFSLRAWQSFSTNSLQVLIGLPLGHGPSTSYSIHFFTQSSSSFRSTCPHHPYPYTLYTHRHTCNHHYVQLRCSMVSLSAGHNSEP